jgi:hypothetical protein
VVFALSLTGTFFFFDAPSSTAAFTFAGVFETFFPAGFFTGCSILVPGTAAFLSDLAGAVLLDPFLAACFLDFETFFVIPLFAVLVDFFTLSAVSVLAFFLVDLFFGEAFEGVLAFAFLVDVFFFETAIGLL